MSIYNGFTPTVDDRKILRAAIHGAISALRDARANGVNSVEFWETRLSALLAKRRGQQPHDNATLQARAAELNAQLEECTNQATGMRILDELVEIENKLARDGERMDDYAEARRQVRFGVGL